MSTLTMSSIAQLAHVERSTVSVWRSRFGADSATPFPAPVPGTENRFATDEVVRWLVDTEHGNNREVEFDAPLYDSNLQDLLSPAHRERVISLLTQARDHSCLPSEIEESDMAQQLDKLCDATYSAQSALQTLAKHVALTEEGVREESLTTKGINLVMAVLDALAEDGQRLLTAWSLGAAALLARNTAAAAELHEDLADANATAQLFGQCFTPPAGPAGSRLHVYLAFHDVDDTLFSGIEQMVLELGPWDAAVIIAPTSLLVDNLVDLPEAAAARTHLLAPPRAAAITPLRYVAALPQGLTRNKGRMALGMWVLAHTEDEFTACASLRLQKLSVAAVEAIAGDALAAAAGGQTARERGFLSTVRVSTSWLAKQPHLHVARRQSLPLDPGSTLAQAWTLRDEVTEALDHLVIEPANDGSDATIPHLTWRAATRARRALFKDMPGAKFSGTLTPLRNRQQPGATECWEREQLINPTVPLRLFDRFELELNTANAPLTQPGDVVYLPGNEPAALVDGVGGRFVRAPVRIARPIPARLLHDDLEVGTVASMLAEDIRAGAAAAPDEPRIRAVARERLEDLAEVARDLEARREAHRTEIVALTRLESHLLSGVSGGALTVSSLSDRKDR